MVFNGLFVEDSWLSVLILCYKDFDWIDWALFIASVTGLTVAAVIHIYQLKEKAKSKYIQEGSKERNNFISFFYPKSGKVKPALTPVKLVKIIYAYRHSKHTSSKLDFGVELFILNCICLEYHFNRQEAASCGTLPAVEAIILKLQGLILKDILLKKYITNELISKNLISENLILEDCMDLVKYPFLANLDKGTELTKDEFKYICAVFYNFPLTKDNFKE